MSRREQVVNFSYPPEAEAFRTEFRAWLDENLTDELRGGAGWSMDPGDEGLERLRAWNRLLADARYAAIAWPEEWGGRGAGLMEQVVFAEEMQRASAPGTLNPLGLSNIAPAIIEHGSEEQKRTLLPRMLRGDDIWCQGFSEPDAGSDLASLRTAAVRDGDTWIVNGQKTWNTLGHMANWCELLVRTDPEAPKHKGISCLLLDMTLAGRRGAAAHHDHRRDRVQRAVLHRRARSRRPDARTGQRRVAGGDDDARVRARHRRQAAPRVAAKVGRLLALARETPGRGRTVAADDPVLRQKLARVYLEAELLKLISDRAISAELHGRSMGPEGSIAKLVWSEAEQHLTEVASDVLGPDALSGQWARDRVYSRALTIAGGTTQVNKNILAQRILGLPRG